MKHLGACLGGCCGQGLQPSFSFLCFSCQAGATRSPMLGWGPVWITSHPVQGAPRGQGWRQNQLQEHCSTVGSG